MVRDVIPGVTCVKDRFHLLKGRIFKIQYCLTPKSYKVRVPLDKNGKYDWQNFQSF